MINLLLLFYSFLFFIIYSFIKKNIKFSTNDPKGPISLPIIGGLHALMSKSSPHVRLQELSKKYGKLMSIWFGDNYSIIVSDSALLIEMNGKHFKNFTDRPMIPTLRLFSPDFNNLLMGPHQIWKGIRQSVSPHFTKTKMNETWSVAINECCEDLLKKLREHAKSGELLAINDYFKKYTLSVVLKVIFSYKIGYDEKITDGFMGKLFDPIDRMIAKMIAGQIFDTIHVLSPIYYKLISNIGNELNTIRSELRGFVKQHMETIDRNNPRDLLDYLILDNMDEDILTNISFDLLITGVETSANTLGWITLFMANSPDVQDKVHSELIEVFGKDSFVTSSQKPQTPYTHSMIKESIRYKHIAPIGFPRVAKESIMIDGCFIPKGTHVIPNYYAMLHDPVIYDNPDTFMPERFLTHQEKIESYIPFNYGERNCIGMNVAMDELYVSLANIFKSFKISSPNGKPLDETEISGIALHPINHFYKIESR